MRCKGGGHEVGKWDNERLCKVSEYLCALLGSIGGGGGGYIADVTFRLSRLCAYADDMGIALMGM